MSRFMFAGCVCLLLGFAPVKAQNVPQTFRTAAGCGPSETQFSAQAGSAQDNVIPPSAGKSLVYVIGTQTAGDTGVTMRVAADGSWKGATTGKAYISFELDPGIHHVCVDWQSSREFRQKLGGAAVLRADEGSVHYFVATAITAVNDDMTLVEVDEAEGLWLLSKATKSNWKESK